MRGEKIRGKEERSRWEGRRRKLSRRGEKFETVSLRSKFFLTEMNEWREGGGEGGFFFFFKKLEICFDRIVVANYANYVTYFAIR